MMHTQPVNGLSIDVEEWFHILGLPSAPEPARWDALQPTVEPSTHRLLEILDEHDTRSTFFILGWVARRYPALVRAIHAAGHEIGSHGNMHDLVCELGRERFRDDIRGARQRLEDLVGASVPGYRAPGFSIGSATPWAFEEIHAAGFEYDSSVFPAAHGHGGDPGADPAPHVISLADGRQLAEFPISIYCWRGLSLPFSGGGYLRLIPYRLTHYLTAQLNASGRPVCVYLHPREIDPTHPRLPMPLRRRFKSYVNLRSMEVKLRRLLADFSFCPLGDSLRTAGILP